MEEQPKKRGGPLLWLAGRSRRFWIIAGLVGLLAGYPLSFGPAIWLTARGYVNESTVQPVYLPFMLATEEPEWLESAVTWWGSLGVQDDKAVTFFYQTDEADHVFQYTRTGEGIPLGSVSRPADGEP